MSRTNQTWLGKATVCVQNTINEMKSTTPQQTKLVTTTALDFDDCSALHENKLINKLFYDDKLPYRKKAYGKILITSKMLTNTSYVQPNQLHYIITEH